MRLRFEKRHLNTKSHKDLSMSIVNRYCVKDPKVDKIKKILRQVVKEYSEILSFFLKTSKWKLHFSFYHTGFISANTEYKLFFLLGCEPFDMLERYLLRQNEYLYSKEGLDTYHKGEMELTFISEVRFMTYNHYIVMPERMVEWNLIRKIHENPKLMRSLEKMPVLNENDCYLYSDSEDEEADDIKKHQVCALRHSRPH